MCITTTVIGVTAGVVFLIAGISLIAYFSTRSSDADAVFKGDYGKQY